MPKLKKCPRLSKKERDDIIEDLAERMVELTSAYELAEEIKDIWKKGLGKKFKPFNKWSDKELMLEFLQSYDPESPKEFKDQLGQHLAGKRLGKIFSYYERYL